MEAEDYRSALQAVVPEKCLDCTFLLVSISNGVGKLESGKCFSDEAILKFGEIANECTAGPEEKGECSTRKVVCKHPLGGRALAGIWETPEFIK